MPAMPATQAVEMSVVAKAVEAVLNDPVSVEPVEPVGLEGSEDSVEPVELEPVLVGLAHYHCPRLPSQDQAPMLGTKIHASSK